jgi:peroxiredoxin
MHMETWRERTEQVREALKSQAPAELLQAFDDGATELGSRDFAAQAVKVGEQAPGFALAAADGSEVTLRGLLDDGPIVLTFYRGSWCPYCNLQLNAYREILAELEQEGVRLVAVSPMTPDNSLSFAEKLALPFTVLSDPGAAVAERYGLVFTLEGDYREAHEAGGVDLPQLNGDESWRLPAPATFIIDRNRTVRFADVRGDYRWRLEPSALLAAVREFSATAVAEL